jgi:serine/threonine protein kinase
MTNVETVAPLHCPPIADLRRLVRGLGEKASLDSLVAHLADCHVCEARIRVLEREEDELITVMRQSGDAIRPPSAHLVEIKARLLNLVNRDATRQHGTASAPFEERQFGPFRLLRFLGHGGMGTVYLARHEMMHRLVALKVIHPHFLQSDRKELISRFETEVRAAGHVSSPQLVTAFDAGVSDGQPYLSMEYVAGSNLSQVLAERGPLPTEEACRIMLQAAAGIRAAHAAGIIHRDIKPSNIMLTDSGDVKVLDLGLALLHRSEGVTTTGQVIGTIQYMAPEQFENAHDIDARADVYALGATTYKLLSGRSPIGDELRHPMKMLSDLVGHVPQRLDELRSDVPRGLADLIARTLSKDRSLRPASVEQFMVELRQVVAELDSEPAIPIPAIAFDAQPELITNEVTLSSPRRFTFFILSALCIAIVCGVIYWSQSDRRIVASPLPGDRPADTQPPESIRAVEATSVQQESPTADVPPVVTATIPGTPPSIWDELSSSSIPAELKQPWHPAELVGIIGSEACRQWGLISHLAFSHDEQWLAVASPRAFDEALTLRQTKDLKQVASLSRQELFPDRRINQFGQDWPAGMDFLPDGKLLTIDRSGRVVSWKFADGQLQMKQFFDLGRFTHYAVVSPDGKLLVGNSGSDNRLFVKKLDELTTPELEILADQLKSVHQIRMRFSSQSGHLLVQDNIGNVMVWDMQSDPPQMKYSADLGDQNLDTRVAISADGQRLAYGHLTQHDIFVRDIQTGTDMQSPLRVAVQAGPDLAFCGDQDSLLVPIDGLHLVRGAGKNLEHIKIGNLGRVDSFENEISTSRSGSFFAARSHGGGTLRLWRNDAGVIREISDTQQSSSWIHHVVFSPDGTKLATLADVGDAHYDHFETWDVQNHRLASVDSTRFEWAINPQLECRIQFDSDSKGTYAGQFLSTMGSTYLANENSYHCNALKPPRFDSAVIRMQAGILKRIDAPRANDPPGTFPETTWDAHPGKRCHRVMYSPDGSTLATIAEYSLRLWEMTTNPPTLISEFNDESPVTRNDAVYPEASFTPDGKRLAFQGNSLWEWNLADPAPTRLPLSGTVAHSPGKLIDYSPDGTRLLLGTFMDAAHSVVLWNCDEQRIERSWQLPGVVKHIAFAPDGHHIAWVNANGTAYLLRL